MKHRHISDSPDAYLATKQNLIIIMMMLFTFQL